MQKINFTGNLENQSTVVLIIEELKETVLDFSQGTVNFFFFFFFSCFNIKRLNITLYK